MAAPYCSAFDQIHDSDVTGDELGDLRFEGARWDSEEVKEWWSLAEARSSVVAICYDWEDWRLLMEILTRFDVSRIENLLLMLPDESVSEFPKTIPQEYVFGDVVLARGSGFSALKTLRLQYFGGEGSVRCLGSDSLAKALRSGVLRNLHSLFLESSSSYPPEILEAVLQGDLPHLTAIQFCTENLPLDVAFQSPRFSKLRGLSLYNVDSVAWQSFTHAVQSGNLSNITDFEIRWCFAKFGNTDAIAKWFSSLKYFYIMEGVGVNVRLLLSALRKAPVTELAWKRLCCHASPGPYPHSMVEELVGLADSGRLLHLDTLDLSRTQLPSKSLLTLIQSIGRSSLPSLQRLVWTWNAMDHETVEAIVEAYYANTSLTTHIDIDWEKVGDPSLERKLKAYRDRNERLAKLVVEKTRPEQRIAEEEIGEGKQVQDLQDLVPLTSARVFICGYPEVGKTTLRKTLLRQFEQRPAVETCAEVTKSRRFVEWCSRLGTTLASKGRASPNERPTLPNKRTKVSNQEPRTRGIEVSRIEHCSNGKSTTLVLWDLAGQEEYHILHSAFLADRGSLSGKVTTFILVFKAFFEDSGKEKAKLLYWLRMLASSSPPGVKRHVMIVLNQFEDENFQEVVHGDLWRSFIGEFDKLFGELDICVEPFCFDVREATDVRLGNHLFDKAGVLLRDLQVPRIFLNLQSELKHWSERQESKSLPILTWEAFKSSWEFGPTETVKDLELGASILHEIGEIIYLKERIVVPNPQWFCQKVVGELLLPKEMFRGGENLRTLFLDDGSIPIAQFQVFFKKLLGGVIKTEDIISMLEHVGLCYRSDEKHLIVPALICDDDYSRVGWNGQGDEVMGRSLTTADQVHSNADQEQKNYEGQESKFAEGRKYLIPAALFRHLQVKLADHEHFGHRDDANYKVGKSFLSCTVGRFVVLVQFDVNPSDPSDDRIDILVQSRWDSSNMKENPVECICKIMKIVEDLCVDVCPGLEYQINCIEPSSASNSIQDMSGRKLMSLIEIKERVVKGEECLSWRTVGGGFVKPETCLSESELKAVVDAVKGRYVACQNDQKAMRIFATKAAGDDASRSSESARDKILAPGSNDREQLLHEIKAVVHKEGAEIRAVVHEEGHRIVRHIDEKVEELKSELLVFRQKHDCLVKEIQAQRALFIADKVRDVPRYIFLSKRETGRWMSITEAFTKTYHLHFLCEARFEENGDRRLMHEVKEQEGIELKNPQEWLVKAKPWLLWSLQVAVMVGKTVGNVYLPGIFSLIPDINVLDSDKLAKAVDTAAAQILEEGKDANQVQVHDRGYGNTSQPVNLEENLIAESVVADLKHELRGTDFVEKTKLSRMMFREANGSTSNQSHSPVVWICKDCIKKYGSEVISFG